jgi:RNA polymerase sigma-70 factor (ECF subfamily)
LADKVENLFNEIYERTNKRILIFITGKCHHVEDVSDIFQETYMELFLILQKKGWSQVRNEEAFLIKIAKSKIFRHYTLLEKMKKHLERTVDEEIDPIVEEVDLSLSPEEFSVQQSMVEQAQKYLHMKDELTKKIFYLYYYEDVKISQIADLLKVGESTVKNRLYRTLKEMRSYFYGNGGHRNE